METHESLFEKGRGQRVVVRKSLRKSLTTLLKWWEMSALEGAVRAQANPSYYDGEGNNKLQTYYENAAAYCAGLAHQIEQSIDSRSLAMATLSLIGDDNTLGRDLVNNVTGDTSPGGKHVSPKPDERTGRGGVRRPDPAGVAARKPQVQTGRVRKGGRGNAPKGKGDRPRQDGVS